MRPLVTMWILFVVGCWSHEQLGTKIKLLEDRISEMESEMREGWANALCRPEVRQLVQEVSNECKKSDGVCTKQAIGAAVDKLDPTGHGHFVALMTSQRHEVVYLRAGTGELEDRVSQRLKRLVSPRWLPTTRFLIIANFHGDKDYLEAGERAEQLIKIIRSYSFDGYQNQRVGKGQILTWYYAFTLHSDESLMIQDRPPPSWDEAFSHGVWIFRLDCSSA